MRIIAAAVAALILSAGPANAGPAAAGAEGRRLELSERYFKAMHMERTYVGVMKSMLPVMLAAAGRKPTGDAFDKAFSEAIDEVMPKMMKEMEAIMVPACAEIFTEEELTGLVNLYESPAGQSLVDKMPLLAAKTSPEMAKLTPKFQGLLVERMLEKICADGACEPDKTPARTPS